MCGRFGWAASACTVASGLQLAGIVRRLLGQHPGAYTGCMNCVDGHRLCSVEPNTPLTVPLCAISSSHRRSHDTGEAASGRSSERASATPSSMSGPTTNRPNRHSLDTPHHAPHGSSAGAAGAGGHGSRRAGGHQSGDKERERDREREGQAQSTGSTGGEGVGTPSRGITGASSANASGGGGDKVHADRREPHHPFSLEDDFPSLGVQHKRGTGGHGHSSRGDAHGAHSGATSRPHASSHHGHAHGGQGGRQGAGRGHAGGSGGGSNTSTAPVGGGSGHEKDRFTGGPPPGEERKGG